MTDHPITPPPELIEQWMAEIWHEGTPVQVAASDLHIATQAAPSLAEEALMGLERTVIMLMPVTGRKKIKRFDIIRRALERLKELEQLND